MLRVFAPAKINMHLHVTGKRPDGYHLLDSLVVFANIGDELSFESSEKFEFQVEGEFASVLQNIADNSVTRAAKGLAEKLKRDPNVRITLQKNLPAGAGIGGGSSDAAACLKGLCKFWTVTPPLESLALSIGSDVPICLSQHPSLMRGIGDVLLPAPELPELSAVFIWPCKPASTPEVYKNLKLQKSSEEFLFSPAYKTPNDLISDLEQTRNDLEPPAIELFPVIREARSALKQNSDCKFARMSGSGSTVFGIFETDEKAASAAETIRQDHPDWWIRSCRLNSF